MPDRTLVFIGYNPRTDHQPAPVTVPSAIMTSPMAMPTRTVGRLLIGNCSRRDHSGMKVQPILRLRHVRTRLKAHHHEVKPHAPDIFRWLC